MTANAEATGAREALLHACADLNCDGETEASALVREFADKHYPAPAPRKVRAEEDGYSVIGGSVYHPSGHHLMTRTLLRKLAALDARADAEGFVTAEEEAPRERCKAPPSDDPPASRVAGQSEAPSPQNGAGAVEAASASPEADGRVWWLYRTAEGWRADEESGEPDAIPVVPREALEAERRALGVYQRGAEEMTRELAQIVCGENEDYVPRSALARVQRERDEARKLARWYREGFVAITKMDVADGARMQLWARDTLSGPSSVSVLDEQLDTLRAERDAALDRARVAEQRIETGVVCWRDEQGCYWQQEPNDLGRRRHGPFTRGRFVADEEGV